MNTLIYIKKLVPLECSCTRITAVIWLSLIILTSGILAPLPGSAADLELLSVGIRARVGEKRVLGEEQPDSFREYDVIASLQLPWESYFCSGWGVSTRLLASAGVLRGADKTALVASVIPVLAFGRQDGFLFDTGAGVAILSRHRYAQQDLGGHLQFALTAGISIPLYRRLGLGYRYLHYSDAGVYGADTIGTDFHMVEVSYRF